MVKFDGTRLATLRVQRGLLQRELGERIGLPPGATQQTVSAWERGEYVPGINTLPALATVLDCSIADFFTARPATQEETTTAGVA